MNLRTPSLGVDLGLIKPTCQTLSNRECRHRSTASPLPINLVSDVLLVRFVVNQAKMRALITTFGHLREMSNRILVVEDSEPLNDLLCVALRNAGFTVQGFLDAESVVEYARLKDADVVVLDVQLPGESGLALAKRLRTLIPSLGILMLSTRSSNSDRIEGYDSGADYYLPKPVSPLELVTGVTSLLNRKKAGGSASNGQCFTLSRMTFMLARGERSVKLTALDAIILTALASAPDRQLERWQLMELISRDSGPVSRESFDVRIHRLRARLFEFTSEKNPIVSVRGVGYKLAIDIEIV